MTESAVQKRGLLALSRAGAIMFRNNVAQGWVGKFLLRADKPQTVKLQPGDVVIRNARVLHAGLCVGSSDSIGWVSVVVTPEMVGRNVAVFAGVEFKDGEDPTPEQKNFITNVRAAGGFAGIARSDDDALRIIGKA